MFAGYAASRYDSVNYLQENATGDYWWSLSPNIFSEGFPYVWFISDGSGEFSSGNVDGSAGIRPAISLASNITISEGTGTSEDPFVVN